MGNTGESASDNSPRVTPIEKSGSFKKVILPALIVLVILGVVMGAYFLGKQTVNNSINVTPTPEPVEENPVIDLTETPTPNISSSTVSGTISPAKNVSATPKITLTPTPSVKTKILPSSAALDGFRSSNNGGNNSLEVRAGRNANLVTRGFVSFDLADIPAGATITESTLRLYLSSSVGNPFGVGGQLKVDHLTYGDSLDSSDYGLAALSSSFVTLTSNATKEWKDAIVTDRVKDDISNARSRSQFRIHFQTENTGGDVAGDFVYFEAQENSTGTGNTPQLVVKYY